MGEPNQTSVTMSNRNYKAEYENYQGTEDQKKRRIKKKISEFYEFETFEKL